MEGHCGHARYVRNLGVEQQSWWNPRRGPAPGYHEQSRQLTEARRDNPWLAAGSQTVQQQALRDFATAMANFFRGSHRRPSWRKHGRSEGFRIVAVKPADVRLVNRRWFGVRVPKVGWVRFRRSRAVPAATSYRITRDRAGRWHVAFAVVPDLIGVPGGGWGRRGGPRGGRVRGVVHGGVVALSRVAAWGGRPVAAVATPVRPRGGVVIGVVGCVARSPG